MRNKKAGHCCWCGRYLRPGEGCLMYIDDEDEMLGIGPFGATGWMVYCPEKEECRARKKKREETRKKREEEKRKIDQMERELFSGGKYIPSEEKMDIEGEEYEREGKGWNIYGGGIRYVVTNTHIWKLQNNGMDGDDWGRNNVRTGGAGAIGYRFPKTEERLAFLKKYTVNLSEVERKKKEEEKKWKKEAYIRYRKAASAFLNRIYAVESNSDFWKMMEKKAEGKKKISFREMMEISQKVEGLENIEPLKWSSVEAMRQDVEALTKGENIAFFSPYSHCWTVQKNERGNGE